MPHGHERAPRPGKFADEFFGFGRRFRPLFHVAPDVFPERQQFGGVTGWLAHEGDFEVVLEMAVGVTDGVGFFVPSQHDEASRAVQFGHLRVDADFGGVPVQGDNASQVFGAKQVDLAGDAVEADDQAPGGECFES
ncbi:hypothetical protein D3C86_1643830 [compost metagenome]